MQNSKLLRFKSLFVVFYYLRFRKVKPMLLGATAIKRCNKKRVIGTKKRVKA